LHFTEIVFCDPNQERFDLFVRAMAFEELDSARDKGVLLVGRKVRAAADRAPALEQDRVNNRDPIFIAEHSSPVRGLLELRRDEQLVRP
jgi:hypothetical protein